MPPREPPPGATHILPGQDGFKAATSTLPLPAFALWIKNSTFRTLGWVFSEGWAGEATGRLSFKLLTGFKSLYSKIISLTCISQVNTGPVHNDT